MNTSPILPPAMLGILGGGQLGRMFTVAAKTMGYKVTVLDPDPNAPAAEFADRHLCAPFDDEAALDELAKCAAVTTEFENVNADAMRFLAKHTNVSPSGDCVAIATKPHSGKGMDTQSRPANRAVSSSCKAEDITEESVQFLPGILKTATLGYDGKGQIRVKTLDELKTAFAEHGDVDCVLEKMVDLRGEISVIVCRLNNDNVQTFDPAENIHENGILAYSIVPAQLSADIQQQARQMAQRLADELNYVGVLAVEMFVVGDTHDLVVNEIAPRPHNSGHHTIDACAADQFQQQVRLMCNLPPADTKLLTSCVYGEYFGRRLEGRRRRTRMAAAQSNPNAHLHLYGKKAARKGRKMGHFTVLANDADNAFQTAQTLHQSL